MKRWEVQSVVAGQLRATLNEIEKGGGTVFSIFDDGERRNFVTVVWFTAKK